MGSTLEAQKAKSPTPKKRIKVSPGKPYYRTKKTGKGFEESLGAEIKDKAQRMRSGKGYPSPSYLLKTFLRGKEEKRGARVSRGAVEAAETEEDLGRLARHLPEDHPLRKPPASKWGKLYGRKAGGSVKKTRMF
jgi:hypothetical protein|tara:strand:+ start:1446 stop:1847 length:402 start_codon:yes stop_codon:yes gene_type:complete